jgi:DNA-binding MarR family transcriptional regulator
MRGTSWLTDDEQRLWRGYLQMHARLTAELNRQLQADSDLSLADYEVLVRLSDAPESRLRPYELQRALEWEQSRLSHHLGRMQRRGLVAREDCATDGRGAYVTLTEAGRDAINAAAPQHVDTVRRYFFEGMTPQHIATLTEVTSGVLDRLDGTPRP